ncbi:MAG: polysaccharide deacetylase family protein [Eubacteriales bacterium]
MGFSKKINKIIVLFSVIVIFSLYTFIMPTLQEVILINEDRKMAIYSVETEDKKIAISFDEGWGMDRTEEILDVLEEYNAKATFFLVGSWVETYPDDVKLIARRGHDLGNHSTTHPLMTELNREQIVEEIEGVHNQVKKLTGKDMILFRPPYGAYDNKMIEVAEECNYYTIKWNVDSYDWKSESVEKITTSVLKSDQLKNGSIILFHNNRKYTKEALEIILARLKEEDYEIVSISEIIIREDYHLDATGRQIKDVINK